MPNALVANIRGALAAQGLTTDLSDDDLTEQIAAVAEKANPSIFDKYPDFAEEWRAIREANSPGTIGGIVNTAKSAYDRSVQSANVIGGIDETDAQDIANREQAIQSRAQSVPWEDWQKSSGDEARRVFLRDPIEITSNIIASGFAGSVPSLVGGVAGGFAGAAAGPVGGAIGAGAGAGAGSLAVEYGSKYLEVLREAGADLSDPESILRVLENPEVVKRAKSLALDRSVPVAAFDALSAGLAGKFLKGLRGATTGQTVRRGLTEAAIQGGLGGAGEIAGALSAGEDIKPGAVFEEVIGELGPGVVEVGAGAMRRQMAESALNPSAPVRKPTAVPAAVAPQVEVPIAPIAEVISPARSVARMTDEQKAARAAELATKEELTPSEQAEMALLQAFVPAVAEEPLVATPTEATPAPVAVEQSPSVGDTQAASGTETPAVALPTEGELSPAAPAVGQETARTDPVKLAEIQQAIATPGIDYQYNVWDAGMVPAGQDRTLQVDIVPPGGTAESAGGLGSTNPALLRELGVDLPPAPDWLPAGRYTLAQVKEAIAKGPNAPAATLSSAAQMPAVAPEIPAAVVSTPAKADDLESRARRALNAFRFGSVNEGSPQTLDLHDNPVFSALTPEQANKITVSNALDESGNRANTRVAVVLESPGGHYIKTGLLVPQSIASVGSGEKLTGPAVQSFAAETRKGGAYQKVIKEGGTRPALLADVVAAGYKLRAIVQFDEAPGKIYQRFANRESYDKAYALSKRTAVGDGRAALTPAGQSGIETKGGAAIPAEQRRDSVQNRIDTLGAELANADPARAAEINEEIQQLYASPEMRMMTESVPSVIAESTHANQLSIAASRLAHAGANVGLFTREFLQTSIADELGKRMDALIERAQNAPEAQQAGVQAQIAKLQQQLDSVSRIRGVTYSPQHIAIGLDNVSKANIADVVTLLHEGGHALLGRDPQIQARVLRAVDGAMAELQSKLAESQAKTGVRESNLGDPEELIVSTIAQKLSLEGIPESPSLARALWQWVKDLYYRTAMGVQSAFGVEPNPQLALDWFENQMRRITGGDYDYRFASIFDRYTAQPMHVQVQQHETTGQTPGGLTDFYDSNTNSVRQPSVLADSPEAIDWNLRYMTEAGNNLGKELDIPHTEAVARIQGAAINEELKLAQKMFADVAANNPNLTFEQWWSQVSTGTTPQQRLRTLASRVAGSETAEIGGEKMTDAMNQLARVEAKVLLNKWSARVQNKIATAIESGTSAEAGLVDQANLVNKVEADLRNAEMHEATFTDSLKAQITALIKAFRRGLDTAKQSGSLAQAVRDAEGLAENDPLPPEYQAVFERVLKDGIPLFNYVDAIAKLDLPLSDLTISEIRKAITDNAEGNEALGRLVEPRNRPLLVALSVLAKKNHEQIDMLQLRREKQDRFLKIYGELKSIREAPEAQLKELEKQFRDGKKVITYADRLKRSYVSKRAKLRRLQATIQESESRQETLNAAKTALAAKIEEMETSGLPAPSEWMPNDGATYLAMSQGENGKWKSTERKLEFTKEGPAVNPEQLLSDMVSNRQYLAANREKAGSKTYQLVQRQVNEINWLDVQRTYPESVKLFFEKWIMPSRDLIVSGGGAGAGRVTQMMNRFQHINFSNWQSEIENPSIEWANALKRITKSAGMKDTGAFLDQVYDPVLYRIGTEAGLDEGPALREAVRAARRRLTTEPSANFDEQFKEFLRKTKTMSETFVKIAEENGVFVEDDRLGGELRKAVARGWMTVMRRAHPGLSTIMRTMDEAGWALTFKDAETGAVKRESFDRGSSSGKKVVEAVTFERLLPSDAASEQDNAARTAVLEDPGLFARAISGFFPQPIIDRWLAPFINKPGQPVFSYNGEDINQLDVQEAWQDAGGNVANWIDLLGSKVGISDEASEETSDESSMSPAAEFRASMLKQIDGLYQMESRIAAESNQAKNLFDPSGKPAHLLMDARENDLLPPEHVQHMTFDKVNSQNLLSTLAFHAAFGRNGKSMVAALNEIQGNLNGRRNAFESLSGSTTAARKADAAANGLNYNELKQAAKVYKQVMDGKAYLEAQFGFGNAAGVLGDVRGGLEILHFVATQTTNNPKTGLLNLLQLTQRMIARRSLGAVAIRDTGRATAEIGRIFFGQTLESFGLHLVRAATHAKEIGAVHGTGALNLPFGELLGAGAIAGKRGEEASLPIKAMRTAMAAQRKGARFGFGESRDFPRQANVPFLSNTMQGLGLDAAIANGVAEVASVESMVKSAMDYFAAHPENLNNPTFRLTNKDLGMYDKAWIADQASFEYFRRALVDYGIGNLEQVAREAMERQTQGEPLLTKQQRLKAAMMSNNELDLQGSINTNPGVWASNPILKFATPLLGWPIRQMSQVHASMRQADGRASAIAAMKAIGILAAWSLPVGLAFTFLTDWYDEKLMKKKTSLGKVEGVAGIPVIGPALALATSDMDTKDQVTAMFQRLSRAGNIYGLGADFASTILSGLDPTSGQRAFSLDSRILAFSQLMNIQQALSNFINSDYAVTYAGLERPLLQSMGGGGALSAIDLFNSALGIDNQEARITARTNANQWLRAAGREVGLELRRGGGGSVAVTPMGTWVREMSLAVFGNDRIGFLDAYRRAVDAAREDGRPNPESAVLESFKSRNPLEVFKTKPTDQELGRALSVMSDSGRQAVTDSLRLFNQYQQMIAPSAAEKFQRRQAGQFRAQMKQGTNLRQQMSSAALVR